MENNIGTQFQSTLTNAINTLETITPQNFNSFRSSFSNVLTFVNTLIEKYEVLGFELEQKEYLESLIESAKKRMVSGIIEKFETLGYNAEVTDEELNSLTILSIDNTVKLRYKPLAHSLNIEPVLYDISITSKSVQSINSALEHKLFQVSSDKLSVLEFQISSLDKLEAKLDELELYLNEIEKSQETQSNNKFNKFKSKDSITAYDLAYESLNFIIAQLKSQLNNEYSEVNMKINKVEEVTNILEELFVEIK